MALRSRVAMTQQLLLHCWCCRYHVKVFVSGFCFGVRKLVKVTANTRHSHIPQIIVCHFRTVSNRCEIRHSFRGLLWSEGLCAGVECSHFCIMVCNILIAISYITHKTHIICITLTILLEL